jgi:hypothetical protein
VSSRRIQRFSQVVELRLICVALRRVRSRVTHQMLERYEVAATLAKEAVRETVPPLNAPASRAQPTSWPDLIGHQT